MNYFRSTPWILPIILLASCTHSTSPGGDGSGTSGIWHIPGKGTDFLFRRTIGTIQDSADYQVVATGIQAGGKGNLVEMGVTEGSLVQWPGFLAFEANNDISVGNVNDGNLSLVSWNRYPTGNHQVVTQTVADSSLGAGLELNQIANYSYVDSESLSTAVGTFSTLHTQVAIWKNTFDTSGYVNDTSRDTVDDWFAPSLGFLVKETERNHYDNGPDVITYDLDLIKYTPR
ncbi:MAG: hypothetical protein ACHQNE_07980 [Candidatus Kapaibacterium sp.]